MNFDSYDLDPAVFDEMFGADGTPHPHCEDLYDTLGSMSSSDLGAIGEWVTRSFTNEGITFTVYGDDEETERIIPIDCVPRVMSAAEWGELTAGLVQRLAALNRFLEADRHQRTPTRNQSRSGLMARTEYVTHTDSLRYPNVSISGPVVSIGSIKSAGAIPETAGLAASVPGSVWAAEQLRDGSTAAVLGATGDQTPMVHLYLV